MPTQSTDVNGVPSGIAYTAAVQTWKILKGVTVTGSTYGVASGYVDSVLKNSGAVSSPVAGVYFDAVGAASDYVVKNGKKGAIDGDTVGVGVVRFNGSAFVQNKGSVDSANHAIWLRDYIGSASVKNTGDVEGGLTGVFFMNGAGMELLNHGEIKADLIAVRLELSGPTTSDVSIDNHGKIGSGELGIYTLSATGTEVKIANHKGATIDGAQFAIAIGEKLNLKNGGKIDGDVISGGFADKVVNKGKVKGDVLLGGGDDVFKNKGDKAKAGVIDMGPGNDLVVLGKKADKLLFDSALNAATNVDTVKKFQSGKDKMFLDDDIFSAIAPGPLSSSAFHKGSSAADADDRIIYDKSTGALYYDPDGTGGMAQTQFARLDPGSKLKASDFTVGEYSIPLI